MIARGEYPKKNSSHPEEILLGASPGGGRMKGRYDSESSGHWNVKLMEAPDQAASNIETS